MTLDRILERAIAIVTAAIGAPRVIRTADGRPYLSRWYVLGRRPTVDAWGNVNDDPARDALPVEVYMHRFHASDDDRALHSHPWKWAIAIVLRGGYLERLRVGDGWIERPRRPGAITLLTAEDFHHVTLIGDESWSLFIAGPKSGSWSFWDPMRRARAPWRLYLAAKHGTIAPWAVPWVADSREGEARR